MTSRVQKEREATIALRDAHVALELDAERLLAEARGGRLLTQASPAMIALAAAQSRVGAVRRLLHELAAEEPARIPETLPDPRDDAPQGT